MIKRLIIPLILILILAILIILLLNVPSQQMDAKIITEKIGFTLEQGGEEFIRQLSVSTIKLSGFESLVKTKKDPELDENTSLSLKPLYPKAWVEITAANLKLQEMEIPKTSFVVMQKLYDKGLIIKTRSQDETARGNLFSTDLLYLSTQFVTIEPSPSPSENKNEIFGLKAFLEPDSTFIFKGIPRTELTLQMTLTEDNKNRILESIKISDLDCIYSMGSKTRYGIQEGILNFPGTSLNPITLISNSNLNLDEESGFTLKTLNYTQKGLDLAITGKVKQVYLEGIAQLPTQWHLWFGKTDVIGILGAMAGFGAFIIMMLDFIIKIRKSQPKNSTKRRKRK